ncbi:MAG: hydrogenase nickel incorporation protein HypB [gamma proteobacterium symbiont of Bathyaustriella thionipta]|nr:hydrogenase nickel incorporation protein HypB [gamma proteobacterium symbiont of Bathyaustriella thionipta]MCU7951116.1 hydrogenase nickel incorporation protein HypB [gamma proteobacterium symbiont of Bathyaustriella thionipta]MCU7953325.1 hydrogenase nickel incorporation protein HypB [gamma proteobacterium symbiont of Bathyaustriella thionipta]MCU7957631.1 hydrogenase nickel incorporation protein HypB [gamma proteobacterium symbiont of Bathyaustriella thionipta]MCU7967328.1 hydrogenase nick
MCDTCGCNVTDSNRNLVEAGGKHAKTEAGNEAIEVLQNLLHENNHRARHNREHFDKHSVLAINLMSSPGSGKTALLEATIDALNNSSEPLSIAVIEGDLETENDAQRIRDKNIPAIQITTGNACHLDAYMVHDALHELSLEGLDIVFIENVGNLVCPASFDLGHHLNVTLLSVTEGDDKPAKYPVMFRAADLTLLSKSDLLPVLDDFDVSKAEAHIRNLANPAPVFQLSARKNSVHNDQGIEQWIQWLKQQITHYKKHLSNGETLLPKVQREGQALHEGRIN